jgi:hypothetical protein
MRSAYLFLSKTPQFPIAKVISNDQHDVGLLQRRTNRLCGASRPTSWKNIQREQTYQWHNAKNRGPENSHSSDVSCITFQTNPTDWYHLACGL